MIRQGLEALGEKTQEPLESDAYRTTDAAQRETFQQQAFDERRLVLRDEVLFKTVDKLPSAVVTVMILFAIVNMAIFLKLGGLAPWTDVSDDHGVLLTSADEDAFLVNHSTPASDQHYMECTTDFLTFSSIYVNEGKNSYTLSDAVVSPGPSCGAVERCGAAAWTSSHTRWGLRGNAVTAMPQGRNASATALGMAAYAPTVPASPTPLTPLNVNGEGVSICSICRGGIFSAVGTR